VNLNFLLPHLSGVSGAPTFLPQLNSPLPGPGLFFELEFAPLRFPSSFFSLLCYLVNESSFALSGVATAILFPPSKSRVCSQCPFFPSFKVSFFQVFIFFFPQSSLENGNQPSYFCFRFAFFDRGLRFFEIPLVSPLETIPSR